MKKSFILFLCLCLFCPSALANGWGLRGELLGAVSSDGRWKNYYNISDQAGEAAVMHSRYHNALMVMENGELKVYTKAVYQPEDEQEKPVLKLQNGELLLAYGVEHYYFTQVDGRWKLASSWGGEIGLRQNENGYGYIAYNDAESVRFAQQIWLEDFNIRLHPRTLGEVRQINQNLAALDSGRDVLSREPMLMEKGKGTVPVYSAPYGDSAWRAAKGKAAVGLKGDVWFMGSYVNAGGERYDCVRYDVSERTQRVGYIATEQSGMPNASWINVPVFALQDTYLTDDPEVSQFQQFQVPKGTWFTCMGAYGNDYAYVGAEVKDGRFVDGGQIVWGFVPLKHLGLDDGTPDDKVAAALVGNWVYAAGGSMGPEYLALQDNGRFESELGSGTWHVRHYHSGWNLYWADVPYEMVLLYDDGRMNIKGLMLTDDGFSLLNWEGSGGYIRTQEAYQPDGPNG